MISKTKKIEFWMVKIIISRIIKQKNMDASKLLTLKRLTGELKNLEKDREIYYQVVQDEKDKLLFYWMLRGDSNSSYKGGYYIGKIILPEDYPTTPGDFYMLTPSGRFNVDSKICLTNSGYHKETWTPMWNIKNMVIGFISVFLDDSTSGISHIKESDSKRRQYAKDSMKYNLQFHKECTMRFDQFMKPDGTVRSDQEVVDFVQNLRSQKKKKKEKSQTKKIVKNEEKVQESEKSKIIDSDKSKKATKK